MKKQKIMRLCSLCLFSLLLILSCKTSYSQTRQQVSLNGTWDFRWDNEKRLAYPPDNDGWTTIEVTRISRNETGFGKDGTNHWAWYKRNVRVPVSMKGQRIKLRFTMVKYQAYVYWNGKKLGEHKDGETPFEIDVTDNVKYNTDNELLVGVIDRLSFQRPDLLPYVERDFRGVADVPPRGSVLGPVSNTENIYGGICDDVDLVSYPEVYIEDFHITTSMRRSEYSVEVTTLNESRSAGNYSVRIFIEDKGNKIKEIPSEVIKTDPGMKTKVLFRDKWEGAHLWSHQDPYLYTLVMQLQRGNRVVDERKFRFGFREFWIEGINFYLNGKVFKIRRNPTSGLRGRSEEDLRKWFEGLKAININQVRIHNSGFAERIAEVADEVGMTLCPESTFYSRAPWYDSENPEMWLNARIHWEGVTKVFKNHPSVVMYSVENEMLSTGSYMIQQVPEKWRQYQDRWIEVGEYIKNLDPTKPLQYSWGHDVRGWAEIANIHYVRDVKYFFQYPRDLYWLEGENLTFLERNYEFKWLKDKPLIKGEFEYWYHCNPPHGLTSFIGEDAYIGDNWSKTWKWCMKKKTEAYRYSGIVPNPWSFDEDRVKFFPLQEAFLKDWRINFYGGESMRKEVIVVNEDYKPVSMTLEVNLAADGRILSRQSFPLEMSEGSRWIRDVDLALPVTEKRINADMVLKLMKDGKELYSIQYPVHIFPGMPVPDYDVKTTGLYDPDGKTLREMTSSGFWYKRIQKIDNNELSGLSILIIGKDAINPRFREEGKVLNEFVRNGGRLIILEQARVEKFDWLPFELGIDKTQLAAGTTFKGRTDIPTLEDISMKGLNATIAFKMMPDHPIMRNIDNEDLRYWRGTHQVSKNNFFRPKFWNYSTIAYVGSGNGIEHTPLVTLPYGKGIYVMTQFIISEEMSKEPAAFMLFSNIMKFAISYTVPSASSRVGVLSDRERSVQRILTLFGAEANVLDELTAAGIQSYDVIFTDGSVNLSSYRTVLDQFLENGGKIVLKELTPETFSNVKSILPADVSLKPMPEPLSNEPNPNLLLRCPTRAYKKSYDPLLAGITNFDLYWRTPSGYRIRFGDEIALIASHVVTGSSIIPLTEPAIYAKIQKGKGTIIIDQVNWETGLSRVTDNTCRIISNFLNNLGIEMRPNITFNQ